MNTILKAANVEVEPYWPTLFAKALEGVDLKQLITNVGSGMGAGGMGLGEGGALAPAGGESAPAPKEEPKEEKKEESEESDEDMGFGLFD
ncbi:60S acidic ribosomal protein P1-like [Centruroides sculpturatus]|uniref:60S acidic ribosomal protein P1-like n=1 Tax=Centruroides sculpturatus TaxID=218467 RepID=UPI000C6E44E1|nr:60S acidic ribosomal protein P1-like [Centruroides sculpturatus]